MTKRCAFDHAAVTTFADDLDASAVVIAEKMDHAKTTFSREASKDWKSWNCKDMYPKPKRTEMDLPNWLGGITKVAKMGFEVYNQVKSLIPGGTKAGAGPVPGSGASASMEELELYEMIGFKEVSGIGMKLAE